LTIRVLNAGKETKKSGSAIAAYAATSNPVSQVLW
jgi:hypothetical protein